MPPGILLVVCTNDFRRTYLFSLLRLLSIFRLPVLYISLPPTRFIVCYREVVWCPSLFSCIRFVTWLGCLFFNKNALCTQSVCVTHLMPIYMFICVVTVSLQK